MRKIFILTLLTFVSVASFSQEQSLSLQQQLKFLKMRINDLEADRKVDSLDKIYLKSELANYSNSYERQWTHFSIISGLLIFIVGVILPLAGLFSLNRSKEEINKKILEIEGYKSNIDKKIESELGLARAEIATIRENTLETEATFLRHVAHVYAQMNTEDDEQAVVNKIFAIRYLIESAIRYTELAKNNNNKVSFEEASKILFSIDQIFSEALDQNEELGEHAEDLPAILKESTAGVYYDFIDDLKIIGKALKQDLRHIKTFENLLKDIGIIE